MKRSDFHIHTNYSDGVFTPEKIVDTALDAGLQAIALTDHDNILSYDVAKKRSKRPEKFGTGIPEGVIASEAANNGSQRKSESGLPRGLYQ